MSDVSIPPAKPTVGEAVMDVGITMVLPPRTPTQLRKGESLRIGRNPPAGPQIYLVCLPDYSPHLSEWALELNNDGSILYLSAMQSPGAGTVHLEGAAAGKRLNRTVRSAERLHPPFDVTVKILLGDQSIELRAVGGGRFVPRDGTVPLPDKRDLNEGVSEQSRLLANAIECASQISTPKRPTNELIRQVFLPYVRKNWTNVNHYMPVRDRAEQEYRRASILDLLLAAREAGHIDRAIVEAMKAGYVAGLKEGKFNGRD